MFIYRKNISLLYPAHCEFTAYQSSVSAKLLTSQLKCCHQPTAEVRLPSQLNLCHLDHKQQLMVTAESEITTQRKDYNSA